MIVSEGRRSSAQAKRDGAWEEIAAEIVSLSTLAEIDAYEASLPDRLASLPLTWEDPIRDGLTNHRTALMLRYVDGY